MLGVMIFLAGFALYQGIMALKNEKAGLTPIDEFSKKITEKAAAKAFKFAVFMLLFTQLFVIDWLSIQGVKETKVVIALGNVAMVLFFIFARIYLLQSGN